jgi:hypothetical protein
MPTTIPFALPTNMTPRSRTIKPDRFHARIGFGILMLWAFVMLSIGAAAHFGAQSSEFITLEHLALY